MPGKRRVDVDESFLQLLDPRPLAARHLIGVAGVVVLAVAPFLTDLLTVQRLTVALYFGMFAMSWDVVSGYTGEISFGHAFFFALGGYTSVIFTTTVDLHSLTATLPLFPALPAWLTIPVGIAFAVLVAALGGLLIGVPALRVSGPYLSLITLIAPLLLAQVFLLFSDTFGGESGLRGEPKIIGTQSDAILTISENVGALENTEAVTILDFYLALVLFVVILLFLLLITRSNAGAVFYAIRSGEDVVAATGKNPAKFKIFVFVLSAAIGGLAGGFLVHSNVGSARPTLLLNLEISLIVIVASVIGGMGTITGAAFGGILVRVFEKIILDELGGTGLGNTVDNLVGSDIQELSFLLLGVAALVIVYAFPGGLLRWGTTQGGRLRSRIRGES
jgi:branched-chain amino acid transport system permease protein